MLPLLLHGVRMVIPFAPADDRPPEIAVEYLECTNFAFLQITAKTSLQVTDVVVNNEFRPALALFDQFRFLRFPVPLSPRARFGAVLQASEAGIPADCCYWKLPVSLMISTNRGPFTFRAGEIIRSDGTALKKTAQRPTALASLQILPSKPL